jgi:peptidoglycan/LPS O-acetylase OafA/YrhL
MGLSALGIIACHASPNGVYLPSPLYQLAAFGQLGVIVFILLSGLGMSYSLGKHKGSMWMWYAKRFVVLPTDKH